MKSTGPLKSGAGVKVTVPVGFRLTSPIFLPVASRISTGEPTLIGWPLISVTDSGSPSSSLSLVRRSSVTGVSSGVRPVSSTATGPSFLPVTVMVRVVVDVRPPGSVTV